MGIIFYEDPYAHIYIYIQFIYVYPFISPLKELERFKSFGSSLLSQEAKLQDLVTDLEQALEELGSQQTLLMENGFQSTLLS